MKSTAKASCAWRTFERDIRQDWEDWSPSERIAMRALAVASTLFAAFYFGLSALALS